ncbi:odorant receptor 67a-like [Drosophila elegans]|uniref:odorant receptor 67a-like n=1 Tax=Drosophila elegans TaxID=30023 RepID=UPI001BC86892|nr:odorant receptor 67a-like [Drosophila elegans]
MKVIFLENMYFNRKIVPVVKPKKVYPVAEDFLKLAMIYFRSMGVEPFESDHKSGLGTHLYLVFHVVNLIFVWVSIMVFVIDSVRSDKSTDFLKIPMVVGQIIFGNVGVLKIIAIQLQKQNLTKLMHHISNIFPQPIEKEQQMFRVKIYLKRCQLISKRFACLLITMITTNSLFAVPKYVIQRWLLHVPNVELNLPFVPIAPWSYRGTWRFFPTYLLQSIAAYTCTCGCVSADLLMFAVAMQVIMHFKRLARTLRDFDVRDHRNTRWAEEDLRKLRSLIARHMEILEHLQSNGISLAVYEMNWMESDPRFRKMLILMSLRAQKPVCLRATIFLDVSFETMSIFMQVSYKFFSAIRLMYK